MVVAVRKSEERVWMIWRWEDTLVGDETIGLVSRQREQLVGLGLTHDLGRFVNAKGPYFALVERLQHFVLDVIDHNVQVQLAGPFSIQRKPSHFALGRPSGCLLSVIFRSPRAEFYDTISFQLVLEF